ncbi:nascent polypeptide-associated complex protein [Candidatus Woesearchaeota archaeon]|nr:nascent polypeptide-associated complex protein [Candidatus Woesearchaeota archaeon]
MFPGMNPRKMQQMMKRMGIQQVDIPATEVIIKTDDKEIVITEPSVAKVNMMGQETFQISGNIQEREASSEPEIGEEDIQTVVEQTGASAEDAKKALEENQGDIAAAILSLKA